MAAEFDKNLEGICIVWVGEKPAKLSIAEVKTKLQSAASYVQIFQQHDACMRFIRSAVQEKSFVIIHQNNTVTIDDLIRTLENLHQVEHTWVLVAKPNLEKKPAATLKDSAKSTCVSSFNDELVSDIRQRIRQSIRHGLDLNVFDNTKQRSTRDLARNAAAFLWFQILLSILNDMNIDEYANQEMIEMCTKYYEKYDNKVELNFIAAYKREYTAEDAILWYTRDCFLYKLLNRALRGEDVYSLYKFRKFIVDLCESIKKLRNERLQSHGPETVTLYRCQFMTRTELGRIRNSTEKLISTNGFISTSIDPDVAARFLKEKPRSPDLVPLIFKITATSDSESIPFADITDLGEYKDEKETLFSLGAVFKIDSVDRHPSIPNLTIVKMTTSKDGPVVVKNYSEICKRDLEDGNLNVIFGRLLIDMGQYRESAYYFENLIKSMKQTTNEDDLDYAPFYHNKGRALGCMGDLRGALEQMNRALDIRRRHLALNNPEIAQTLNSIGVIDGETGSYASAMAKFKEALEIFETQLKGNVEDRRVQLQIATTKTNIGWINYLKGNYGESEKLHNESLKIRKSLLSEEHPLVADNLSAIGALQHAKGEYVKAKKSYEKTLFMREKALPADHPAIANSYQCLGGVELENGRYPDALNHYNKALHILTGTLTGDHLLISGIERSIGSVYLEKGEHEKALKHFSKALKISVKTFSENHLVAGECYHSMGMVYERQGTYQKAIDNYKKALERIQPAVPTDHPSIAKIHSSIASAYLQKGDFAASEKYLNQCHDIQKKNYSQFHPDLVLTLNNLGVLHTYKDEFDAAERYLKQALSMCEKCFAQNHLAVSRTRFNLGELYVLAKKYDEAISNYGMALSIREAALPTDDLSLADIHARLGYVHFLKRSYPSAEQEYMKSRSKYQPDIYPEHRAAVERTNENLRVIQLAIDQLCSDDNKKP